MELTVSKSDLLGSSHKQSPVLTAGCVIARGGGDNDLLGETLEEGMTALAAAVPLTDPVGAALPDRVDWPCLLN